MTVPPTPTTTTPMPFRRLSVGQRSVLFGAHQFLLHPLFVAAAWVKLYGVPTDPRLWAAFFLHDAGYFSNTCTNMDGPEGERHAELGARLMWRLFDQREYHAHQLVIRHHPEQTTGGPEDLPVQALGEWGRFTLLHSRFYARAADLPFSRLCVADKLACALTWDWLYLPSVLLSGEVWEYLEMATYPSKYTGEPVMAGHVRPDITREELAARRLTPRTWRAVRTWRANLRRFMFAWVEAHRHGDTDTWTPAPRTPGSLRGLQ